MRFSRRALQLVFLVSVLAVLAPTSIGQEQTRQAGKGHGLIESGSPKEVRLRGELEVIYEDSHPSGRLLYFLHTEGKKLSIHFAENPQTMLHSGMQVDVEGVQVGETLELNSGGSLSPASGAPAVSGNPMGQHRVLVIMVNFQDKQTQPFTQTQVQSVIATTSDYFREGSYNQTWLTGDVFGWYTIPMSYTACDTSAIATYAQQAAVAAGANLSAYDHLVYAFPENACTWAGRGSVGGAPSQAWLNGWFDLRTVGHEIGHNFGLYHARSMDCGVTTIGSNCTVDEYGDILDLMGSASSAHFNLYQKERLGWVNSATNAPITTVGASGSYWIEAFESGNLNPKGLKILKSIDPVTGLKTWYYVEHRAATGFDSFVGGNANVLNGVIVRTGSEASGQQTYLLDMTPVTTSWYDPALTVGESFIDADAAVTITTVSADANGAMVDITVAPQPCSPANPTVTVSPSQSPWVASGAVVSFDVSVRNNDQGGCTASAFNWQATLPTGWSAVFTSPSMDVAPGATGTTTMQVSSASGAADGFYNISAAATNSANTTYFGSASGTYSLVSALSVVAGATQVSYMRNQTATVNTTVRAAGVTQPGVPVIFTMTRPNGSIVTSTATTGANGVAVFMYSFNRKKDPAGTYQVLAQANSGGVSGAAVVSFKVK